MAEPEHDEFYVGYWNAAPPGVARHVRRTLAVVLSLALGLAALLAWAQRDFAAAFFEFGRPRSFAGTVALAPQPALLVARPGRGAAVATSRYLLVGAGKHGAWGDVGELDGRQVRLAATLIYRDASTMLEIVPGSVEVLEPASLPPAGRRHVRSVSLGQRVLEGEIVDSKCFLGVMNPGALKAHRTCAALCIRGGAPPLLVLRRGDVPVAQLLLVGPHGEAIHQQVLDVVAEPVRLRGEVVQIDETWVLRVDPTTIERLL